MPQLNSSPIAPLSRQKLTLARKLIFSAMTMGAVFGGLELSLWLLGVSPLNSRSDPLAGFAGQVRLFAERQTPEGDVLATAPGKRVWFNQQSFSRDKPSGRYRIFCVGGSTTYGRPYDDRASYCRWLRDALPRIAPSRTWDVVNAGGISYASHRISILMQELIEHKPDLFIIYTGHNEFLERTTYSSLFKTPAVVRNVGGRLGWSRTYSVMHRAINGPRRDGSGEKPSGRQEDIDGLLDRSVGPDAYERDEPWRRMVASEFRKNLNRMIDLAETAGAEVILVTPASNLRECTPFKSQHRNALELINYGRWQTDHDRAFAALEARDADRALEHIRTALQLDDRHAGLHFLQGRALLLKGDTTGAKAAFLRAREEDVCTLRATTILQTIVRDVATERSVPLVDFSGQIEQSSADGIPGDDWFLDHVHPTLAGHRKLAKSLLHTMHEIGAVPQTPSGIEDVFEVIAAQIDAELGARERALALKNLAKVHSWAGKLSDAHRFALQAAPALPNDAEAQTMAGVALLSKGQLDEAERHLRRALELNPREFRAMSGLGKLHDQRGEPERAAEFFRQVLEVEPDSISAHYNLGNAMFDLGDDARAEASYRAVLKLFPKHADAHGNLGLVLARREQSNAALTELETALAIEPYRPHRHSGLGFALIDAGELGQATQRFETALQMDIRHVPAYLGLALVHERKSELAEADSHLRRALEIAPDNPNVRASLVRVTRKQKAQSK